MSIVVNTNVPSLVAGHHLRTTRDGLETAMERLSSGKRINSAADDAAGVGLAARLQAQIRGTEMAMRGTGDGIALLNIADNALTEVSNMVQRVYELAIQVETTGVYSSTDEAAATAEITALHAEAAQIISGTKYNNSAIFGGTFTIVQDGYGSTLSLGVPATFAVTGTASSAAMADLSTIATNRGTLAAMHNRLEYKLNNLSVVSAQTGAALSRVEDTDYAAESAAVAKGQVLQQAGAAMLAQANASAQYVLTLLQ